MNIVSCAAITAIIYHWYVLSIKINMLSILFHYISSKIIITYNAIEIITNKKGKSTVFFYCFVINVIQAELLTYVNVFQLYVQFLTLYMEKVRFISFLWLFSGLCYAAWIFCLPCMLCGLTRREAADPEDPDDQRDDPCYPCMYDPYYNPRRPRSSTRT